jgi:tRNA pseudouridine38-40 synthase
VKIGSQGTFPDEDGGVTVRVRLLIEFDGTSFCGWQVQPVDRTVQGELQKALGALLGEPVEVAGSSRTDSGVHAREYPVSFETSTRIPAANIASALNRFLPEDIRALSSREMSEGFHARYDSRGKTYSYRILSRRQPTALYRNYAYHVKEELSMAAMEEAAKRFVGTHDFRGFMSMGSIEGNTVKTVREVSLRREGDFLIITITASGFLYNMARIMVGTLLDVGLSKITGETIREILRTGNRGKSMVVPARGLYLERVYYDEDEV